LPKVEEPLEEEEVVPLVEEPLVEEPALLVETVQPGVEPVQSELRPLRELCGEEPVGWDDNLAGVCSKGKGTTIKVVPFSTIRRIL
jgi:hypothetical protein